MNTQFLQGYEGSVKQRHTDYNVSAAPSLRALQAHSTGALTNWPSS